MIFSSGQERHGFGHFQAQMTLVNNGGSPVSGWTVQLTLPVHGVDSVESQNGRDGVPFEHWQFSGDTLTITADTGSETLGPGAPMNLSIDGRGNPASPTGCTFNGAACPISVQQGQPPGQFAGQDQPPGQQPAGPGQEGQWAGPQDQWSRTPGGQGPGPGQPYR